MELLDEPSIRSTRFVGEEDYWDLYVPQGRFTFDQFGSDDFDFFGVGRYGCEAIRHIAFTERIKIVPPRMDGDEWRQGVL